MTLAVSFALAFFSSLILTQITIKLAKKYKFVDDPKSHRHPAILHKKVIPRAGGLPIFLAVVFVSLLVLPLSQQLVGIIAGGLVLVAVGLLDDRRDLPASWKLAAQIGAAIIVVASGVGIAFITNPLGGVIRLDSWRVIFDLWGQHSILVFADLFALFWIVWVINMVNFSSGVDGQMPGIVLVALLVLLAASLRFGADPSQLMVQKLALVGAGATLGFLVFNFYPAKIFPGDSGSYFLGYLVAVVAILSGAKVGAAILVMMVPLVDGVFTIVRRIASGKSPFVGDRSHLHHQLLELGWGQRRIALYYALVCAILGAAALRLSPGEKIFAGLVSLIAVIGGLLWLNMNLPQKAQE